MEINYDFISKWKEFGDRYQEDPINQFFYYFVAFNCLYENVFSINYPYGNDDKLDRDKIKDFLEHELYRSYKRKGFSPCADLNKIPELKQGVARGTSQKVAHREHSKIDEQKSIADQERQLFLNIYQVRCNLFHGQKELRNDYDRNFRLIEESVWVLENLLNICLAG